MLHYRILKHKHTQHTRAQTIVIFVQALKRKAQLLLVVLQVLGELVEVQTPVLVLITRGHDFLQTGGQKRERQSRISEALRIDSAGIPSPGTPKCATVMRTLQANFGCTCAAPWRNIPIALRPARNSATSTFPSLLVSSLSNRSWYDLSLLASQHRAVGRKNLRMF